MTHMKVVLKTRTIHSQSSFIFKKTYTFNIFDSFILTVIPFKKPFLGMYVVTHSKCNSIVT